MNSQDVSKALKKEIFPFLRKKGFAQFTTRTAWKNDEHVISVINFASLGSYLGDRYGILSRLTSHSFWIEAGLYFKAMHETPWAKSPAPNLPKVWECQARKTLKKSLRQFWCRRPDVWYVSTKGTGLDAIITDAKIAVQKQASK